MNIAGLRVSTLLLIASVIYAGIFAGLVWWFKPGRKRVVAALAGGIAAGLVGVPIELLVHHYGWVKYKIGDIDTPIGPYIQYPFIVIAFALIALIGWRIDRRFGLRGQAAWIAFIVITGVLRDRLETEMWLKMQESQPGLVPIIVDMSAWTILSIVAMAVMRRVSTHLARPAP